MREFYHTCVPALAALSHRPFRIYIAGQSISLVGLWMQQVAHSWVVSQLTTSKLVFASVQFASSAAMVALMLPGGVIADRFDRRRVLIVTQVLLAALAFAYAALVWGGIEGIRLWHIYVIAVVLGAVAAFDLPAQQAIVPELVPPQHIGSAVAVNQSVFHGARFVGPAVGGVLMPWLSMAGAFLANGVSYFAAIASLIAIRVPPREHKMSSSGARALSEGLSYVAREPTLRALMGFTALTTMFVFTFLIVFIPEFITELLDGREVTLAVFMSGTGLGGGAGALVVAAIPPRARGRVIIWVCPVVAGLLAGISRVENVILSGVLVGLLAFAVALAMGLTNTVIQVTVANEYRGRVMSVYGMMFVGVMPLTALGLGVLGDAIGLRHTLTFMAAAYLVTAMSWLVRVKVWTVAPGKAE